MTVLKTPYTQEPMITPTEITEDYLQGMLDDGVALNAHLDSFPDSIHHVRWKMGDDDPGCIGAAVVLAMIEKNLSRIKARIMNKQTKEK